MWPGGALGPVQCSPVQSSPAVKAGGQCGAPVAGESSWSAGFTDEDLKVTWTRSWTSCWPCWTTPLIKWWSCCHQGQLGPEGPCAAVWGQLVVPGHRWVAPCHWESHYIYTHIIRYIIRISSVGQSSEVRWQMCVYIHVHIVFHTVTPSKAFEQSSLTNALLLLY